MSDTDTKATTKSSKSGTTKKRERKPVELTAAAHRPPRTHRKPNRFEFGADEAKSLGSKRKRAASRERSPAPKKKRSSSKTRSTKKSTKGKKKDPNAPKKPLTAYMIFASANREKVKKENPDAGFGEIGKILGKLWSKASKSEKSKYEGKAEKDKERYEKEMAKYEKSSHSDSSSEEESSD